MRLDLLDLGFRVPLKVDRIWGIWGSYYNIPKAIFYLLKGDYSGWGRPCFSNVSAKVGITGLVSHAYLLIDSSRILILTLLKR